MPEKLFAGKSVRNVALLLPSGHQWPLAQLPEHCELAMVSLLPKRPGGHAVHSEPAWPATRVCIFCVEPWR